jgi:hypothetical protein
MTDEARIRAAAIEYCKRIIEANGCHWREVFGPGGTQTNLFVGGTLYLNADFGEASSRRVEVRDWQDAAMHVLSQQLRRRHRLEMPEWFPPFPTPDDEVVEVTRIEEIKDEIESLGGWYVESTVAYEPRVSGGIYCHKDKYESGSRNYGVRPTLAEWEELLKLVRDLKESCTH